MKKISLTFDDGPNPGVTESLLVVLAKHGVTATFFMIGEREARNSQIAKLMETQGHTIENHTWSHRNLCGATWEELEKEINGWGQYFRPPGGHYDEGMLDYLRLYNIQFVLWDIDSFDYALKMADSIEQQIDEQIGDGGIILLHDGDSEKVVGDRWNTVEVVDKIIPKYRALGYEFVPLSEMELPGKPRKTIL